jgi:hypothetical protein
MQIRPKPSCIQRVPGETAAGGVIVSLDIVICLLRACCDQPATPHATARRGPDPQSRRSPRHPLFRVIFHQPETTASAAAPSLPTRYAKERVKWLIIP